MTQELPRKRVFKRMLLIFSLTSLFTVSLLLFFIYKYYTNIQLDANLKATETIANKQLDTLQDKQKALISLTQDIYRNSDLMQDVQIAMTNDYSSYTEQNIDNYFKSKSFYSVDMETYLRSYFSYDEDIIALQLVSDDGSFSYTFPSHYREWKETVDTYGEENIIKQASKEGNFYTIENKIVVKQPINDPSTLKQMGYLLLYIDSAVLNKSITKNYKNSIFQVTNDKGAELYTNHPVEHLNTLKKQGWLDINNKKMYYQNIENEISGLKINTYLYSVNDGNVPLIEIALFGIGLLLVIFSVSINFIISRRYSKRILTIIGGMNRVEKGTLDAKLPVDNQGDELTMISERFNHMTENLDAYIKKVYTLEMEEQKARMKALQGQVQPHFLYNSLEVIRMNARVEGAKATSDMIYQLATLLRYTANHREITTLEEEINYVKQYVRFMEMRHEQPVTLEINIEKRFNNTSIPRFALQPLIENFFKYAYKENSQPKVKITVTAENNNLLFEVIDNGSGMDAEKLAEVQMTIESKAETSHIGLANLNKRLQLLYGEAYHLSIMSKLNEGTIILFQVPAHTGGEK
ncbi:sensor histidine kinase [Listeria ivanovii]|uniref:Putative two-component sensor histidine kinase n=1 Tax=Listeria ivanovii (strain ATCC BAA-678 / PAM 55) TaxID=881621 RepID=G2ZCT8_LISIP|nr:sensor histidine kinase [Listeria ivanovii]MBK3914040.1 sensor histidine kinase [Listeria ivanovii subsp. ivanovii]MBK3921122.1 sensor histidine kinase [Listeria ivanovii subsp. ivanovii]MBK3926286.1 sensor histidine kinase [Listeria ivanovii subsp. ivanovii]MCJ1717093.1 sensor histidine kinase [Listeria ivanovii]MCJ1722304.1 sensor histidine kinase [Listeria ivanovii]